MADYKEADFMVKASDGKEYLGVWMDEIKMKNGGSFTKYKIKIQRPYTRNDGAEAIGWDIEDKEITQLIECLFKAQGKIAAYKEAAANAKKLQKEGAPEVISNPVSFDNDDIAF